MAIKVQKFVIDDAVLDLIGNEFKFDHAKGLAEWLKNSCDAYLRESVPDDEQLVLIRFLENSKGQLSIIECVDFVGMDKSQIDDAFKRFFDPEAAKKGGKEAALKTFGGHGNGGKFYMRQMFRTSQAISYRDGKMNVFGFNARRQYGFEDGYEDRPMAPEAALKYAGLEGLDVPQDKISRAMTGETGFTVVRGVGPAKVRGTSSRDKLLEKLRQHPQARRLMERRPIFVIFNDETDPFQITAPRVIPKPGFEEQVVIEIPETLESEGRAVAFSNQSFPWPGRLVLRTSKDPLRGSLSSLNTIDFIGEVGVIASYRAHELGATRYSGQSEFIYGECECPVLEDPENDCVRNDRQKLIENDRSLALLPWVRARIEDLAERMEIRNRQEKRKQDLKNTGALNELLNRWKNRFMNQIWVEVFAGRGPSGVSGLSPGAGRRGGKSGGGGGGGRHGEEGGSEKQKKPRFPKVLISGQDTDPFDPLGTDPFECDPRHPVVYQRTKDVDAGVYWINTSRSLAEKIIQQYSCDSSRWREYLFQRYVDIIAKEAVYQLGKMEPSLTPDDVNRCIDDITSKIHEQAAKDLDSFLFDEKFGLG